MARAKKKTRKNRASGGKGKSFVAEYLQDHNATAAAIRCGYSPKGAASWGSRLAKKYKAEIQQAIEASNRRLEVSADRIRQELAELAYLPIEGIKPYMLRAKVKALELLAKHAGMMIERQEVSLVNPVTIFLPESGRGIQGVQDEEEGANAGI